MQVRQATVDRSPLTSIHGLALRRARDGRHTDDGMRVLVDRYWPRGLSRTRVAADLWLRELAPSERLLHWWSRIPNRWDGFAEKYRAELLHEGDLLRTLDDLLHRGRVTLVYESSDAIRNNARVLQQVLMERRLF